VNYPRTYDRRVVGRRGARRSPAVKRQGYNSIALQHSAGKIAVHADIHQECVDKGKAPASGRSGHVLSNRGMLNAMLTSSRIRTAQENTARSETGNMRWGIGTLNPTRTNQATRFCRQACTAQGIVQ